MNLTGCPSVLTSKRKILLVIAASATAFTLWRLFPFDESAFVAERSGALATGPGDTKERIAVLEAEMHSLRMQLAGRSGQGQRATATQSGLRASALIANEADRNRQFQSGLATSFQSQPVNPGWATETKADLEEALITTAAEQEDLPAPDSTRMQCKSSTCRIEARYKDEDSALFGVQLLQTAFASRLPSSHQYTVRNTDGSVTLVMYASKGPAAFGNSLN
jgi:hypothetical protein